MVDRPGELPLEQFRPGLGERRPRGKRTARIRVSDDTERVGGSTRRGCVAGRECDLGLSVEQRCEPEIAERGALLRRDVERMVDLVGDHRRRRVDVALRKSKECETGMR